MVQFTANISWLFAELPFRARFSAARLAGFSAVDLDDLASVDGSQIAGELSTNGLPLVTAEAACGDRLEGEYGLACLPGLELAFESAFERDLMQASLLGIRQLHVPAGIPPASASPGKCFETYIANLAKAADMAATHDITVLIQPMNVRDEPGFYLSSTAETLRVLDTLRRDNLKVQLDLYHRQIMEGDLAHGLHECRERLGHVRIANVPLRSQPDHGEIDFRFIFELLDALNYNGWVGCAYKPSGATRDSLGWMRSLVAADDHDDTDLRRQA